MDAYAEFLARKAITAPSTGLTDIPPLPERMFPFQRDIVAWALRRGRAALFAGTGLGKSYMELAWADAVHRETGRDILHLAPLAVTAQMVREADKFGMAARQVRTQADVMAGTNITNYQKLEHFDLSQFGGVILDESGILKNESGHYRTALIKACAQIPFRLAATATPAPNDYMELGNHAEFLGVMSYTDMLATFFTHDGGETQKWRLKGHAENDFWRWMASWSVMLRKPSDLGYDDTGYDLPPLRLHQHTVGVDIAAANEAGFLFAMPAETLAERQAARRDTIKERVAKAAEIAPPAGQSALWWCSLNAESEALAKAIPGAVELRGSDSEDEKERKILGFCDGSITRMVTKSSMMGFGVNAQVCHWTCFVGLNDSWEQYYQAVRRFWRFGQGHPVDVHMIAAETEGNVIQNLRRKEADADRMMAAMVRHTSDISSLAVRGQVRDTPNYNPQKQMELPAWLAA
jgi:superfamily II DNA or RNA helicase